MCIYRGCTCLRSALPLARARSAPTKQVCTNTAHTPLGLKPNKRRLPFMQMYT